MKRSAQGKRGLSLNHAVVRIPVYVPVWYPGITTVISSRSAITFTLFDIVIVSVAAKLWIVEVFLLLPFFLYSIFLSFLLYLFSSSFVSFFLFCFNFFLSFLYFRLFPSFLLSFVRSISFFYFFFRFLLSFLIPSFISSSVCSSLSVIPSADVFDLVSTSRSHSSRSSCLSFSSSLIDVFL